MKGGVVLFLCFLPLGLIYIIMKLSLLLSSSVSEIKYVKEDGKRLNKKYVENPYGDIDEEEENY